MVLVSMKIRIGFLTLDWLAITCVVMPTILSVIYFGLIASDIYISESRFVVKAPDKPTAAGLGLVLKGIGFSSSGDELLSTQEYVMSRDALAALNKNKAFEKAYSRPEISIFNRFDPIGTSRTFEDLFRFYSSKVDIDQDSKSGVAVLTVRAYTPQDAVAFNKQLLDLAEVRVNEMNERGRQDLVRYAQKEVDAAKQKAWDSASALARYRNEHHISDPKDQSAVALQLVAKLQDELIASRTQLGQLRAFTPQNPQIPVLENQEKSISEEINTEISSIAGNRNSLAASSVEYQRLLQESEFATNQLNLTMASLQQAQSEAARQQAYVETIAEPMQPDDALEPRRVRGIFTTFILGLVAWGILSMLLAGILEHRE